MSPEDHGYSSTPLAAKLGIREGSRVLAVDAPREYGALLGPLPLGSSFVGSVSELPDIVHLFCEGRAGLGGLLAELRLSIKADCAVWVSWPKKASGRARDLNDNVIRELALPLGFVDVKVCAVSEVWSALKLVIRKELR